MKKVAIFLVMLCGVTSAVFAGDESWEAPKYGEIQSYDFNLEIEVDGSSILANWNAFPTDENMKWYKLVYSEDNEKLSYPEDTAHFVGYNATKTSEKLWLKAGKSYYIRLCAITHESERYCSKVKKVEIPSKEYQKTAYTNYKTTPETVKKISPNTAKKSITDVANKKKEYYETQKDKKETYINKKTSDLSVKMKTRVDTALQNFVERLEKKGYSDEMMVETLEKVIDRIETLKKQDKYATLAKYIILVLEEYLAEYSDDFSEIENILEEF